MNLLILLPILLPMLMALPACRRGAKGSDRPARLAAVAVFLAALLCAAAFARYGAWPLELPGFCGFGLRLRLDGFRVVYALATALLWLVTTLFSREYFGPEKKPALGPYYGFSLLTLGAVMGVFLSADFFTTFLFFELGSLASYPLVVHDRGAKAMRAGETYLAVAVTGGMAMLMGLYMLHSRFGTLEFAGLRNGALALADKSPLYAPGILLLAGFGAKAGMFPLHIWLPKAHPVAPAPASAQLSGILTKTGVFGILALSGTLFAQDAGWGLGLLAPAAATMVWGAVLALLSVDMKRTLACSSVSQIGFILVGVSMQGLLGEHNALAVRGTMLHMVNHTLLKLVLFLLAGVVYKNLHKLDYNDIRGFGRGKPLFALLFLLAAFGIGGVPLFSGYISKTLLHESIVEAVHLYRGLPLEGPLQGLEILFLFTGGLTVAYMLKLFVVLFVEKPPREAPSSGRYLSRGNAAMLMACALLFPLLGTATPLMDGLAGLMEGFVHGHPPDHAVHYFVWGNLKGAVISLAVGGAVYLLAARILLRKDGVYLDRLPRRLDLENTVYRPALRGLIAAGTFFARLAETIPDALARGGLFLLRQSRPKEGVSKFYARFYWLFHARPGGARRGPEQAGTLSYALLLFGIGLSAVLLYVFLRRG